MGTSLEKRQNQTRPRLSPMLKGTIILLIGFGLTLLGSKLASGSPTNDPQSVIGSEPYFARLADKLWLCEGGRSAKWPYGVRGYSWDNVEGARIACLNTIRSRHQVWLTCGTDKPFLDFLCDSYCPTESDPTGNTNLKRNLRLMMAKG